jgi:hypothetical protein
MLGEFLANSLQRIYLEKQNGDVVARSALTFCNDMRIDGETI